jgi:hypothetical protein
MQYSLQVLFVADASTNKVWKEYKVTNAIKKVQFKEVN